MSDYSRLFIKISKPIKIRIEPPKMLALLANFNPNFLPSINPNMQIKKVTMPMIIDSIRAKGNAKLAIVKPTDRASIDVAIPWMIRPYNDRLSLLSSLSSSFLKLSRIMLLPINNRRIRAI